MFTESEKQIKTAHLDPIPNNLKLQRVKCTCTWESELTLFPILIYSMYHNFMFSKICQIFISPIFLNLVHVL